MAQCRAPSSSKPSLAVSETSPWSQAPPHCCQGCGRSRVLTSSMEMWFAHLFVMSFKCSALPRHEGPRPVTPMDGILPSLKSQGTLPEQSKVSVLPSEMEENRMCPRGFAALQPRALHYRCEKGHWRNSSEIAMSDAITLLSFQRRKFIPASKTDLFSKLCRV